MDERKSQIARYQAVAKLHEAKLEALFLEMGESILPIARDIPELSEQCVNIDVIQDERAKIQEKQTQIQTFNERLRAIDEQIHILQPQVRKKIDLIKKEQIQCGSLMAEFDAEMPLPGYDIWRDKLEVLSHQLLFIDSKPISTDGNGLQRFFQKISKGIHAGLAELKKKRLLVEVDAVFSESAAALVDKITGMDTLPPALRISVESLKALLEDKERISSDLAELSNERSEIQEKLLQQSERLAFRIYQSNLQRQERRLTVSLQEAFRALGREFDKHRCSGKDLSAAFLRLQDDKGINDLYKTADKYRKEMVEAEREIVRSESALKTEQLQRAIADVDLLISEKRRIIRECDAAIQGYEQQKKKTLSEIDRLRLQLEQP